MARKVLKTVSPQLPRILLVAEVLVVLSVFYLFDFYYFRRPMPNWVPIVAGGALVLTFALVIALRNQLAVLRLRTKALPSGRQSAMKRYSALMGICGAVGPYIIWYVIPQGADHSRPPGYDLAVFAFVAVEVALFLGYMRA